MTTFECIRPLIEQAERERKAMNRKRLQRQINALIIIGTWAAILGAFSVIIWGAARAIDKGF